MSIRKSCTLLLALSLLLSFGCKTTEERTKEQSQTQNSLTNYVKTPQDRARNMKSKVEAAQNSVASQGRQAGEGE